MVTNYPYGNKEGAAMKRYLILFAVTVCIW